MTLGAILLATLAAGIGSVWVADMLLRVGFGHGSAGRAQQGLLSLAAGALLSTAFLHLLPEAFASGAAPQHLFTTLLVGIVFFFLLTKAELWHHGHEHAQPPQVQSLHPAHHADAHEVHADAGGHSHDHAHHHHHHHSSTGWSLLTGDSVHCFGDGVLIASAFLADIRLGLIAAVSVLAHEVPHHMGDLVVMGQGRHRRVAMLKVSLAGAVTALGGVAGYFLVGQLQEWLPFFLVVACSSFIYVALSDLIPQLQKRLSLSQTLVQVLWLVLGIVLVAVVSNVAHGFAHGGHGHDGHDHNHGAHSHAHQQPAAAAHQPAAAALHDHDEAEHHHAHEEAHGAHDQDHEHNQDHDHDHLAAPAAAPVAASAATTASTAPSSSSHEQGGAASAHEHEPAQHQEHATEHRHNQEHDGDQHAHQHSGSH